MSKSKADREVEQFVERYVKKQPGGLPALLERLTGALESLAGQRGLSTEEVAALLNHATPEATRRHAKRAPSLTTAEAASHIGMKTQTLANWRSLGKGPAWVQVGGRVLYAMSDLEQWLASNRVEPGAPRADLRKRARNR